MCVRVRVSLCGFLRVSACASGRVSFCVGVCVWAFVRKCACVSSDTVWRTQFKWDRPRTARPGWWFWFSERRSKHHSTRLRLRARDRAYSQSAVLKNTATLPNLQGTKGASQNNQRHINNHSNDCHYTLLLKVLSCTTRLF